MLPSRRSAALPGASLADPRQGRSFRDNLLHVGCPQDAEGVAHNRIELVVLGVGVEFLNAAHADVRHENQVAHRDAFLSLLGLLQGRRLPLALFWGG